MANETSDNIYDLGYQRYQGLRLGRRHAIWALYTHSLRSVFGIGRSGWAKLASFGILGVALIPAIVILALSALSSPDKDPVDLHNFVHLIEVLIIIFCAVIIPVLIGQDQRAKTISLYFSRALRREDYVLAKYAALISAVMILAVVPQLLIYIGNVAGASHALKYLQSNWDIPFAVFASAALLSFLSTGIGTAIASWITRRVYSTVAIIFALSIPSGIAAAVFEAAGPSSGKFALLLSPFHLSLGFTLWIFRVPKAEWPAHLVDAGLFDGVYVLAAIIASIVTISIVIYRYRSLEA